MKFDSWNLNWAVASKYKYTYVCMHMYIAIYIYIYILWLLATYIGYWCVSNHMHIGYGSNECVYLNGNGVGLQPKATKKLIDEELLKWRSK